MRFKAELSDPRALLAVLSIMKSIEGSCIVRLMSSRTRFFTDAAANDSMHVWTSCRSNHIFKDFHCDSNYDGRSITCHILDLAALHDVVRQAERRSCGTAAIRLSTSPLTGNPIFKISLQGGAGLPDLSYDLPIRILSGADIERLETPPLREDLLCVTVPNLMELATFIDKLRSTNCEHVTFSARENPPASGSDDAGVVPLGLKRPREQCPTATLIIHAETFRGSYSLKYDDAEVMSAPGGGGGRGSGDDSESSGDDDNNVEEEDEEVRGCGEEGDERDNAGDAQPQHRGKQREMARRRRRTGQHSLSGRDSAVLLQSASATVEIKRFSRFFSVVNGISPAAVRLHLDNSVAVIMSASATGGTTLAAYIPATSVM